LLAGFTVAIAWLLGYFGRDWATLLAMVGGLLSAAFVLQKQYLDELRLFQDLFKDFNSRYAKLNDDLLSIMKTEKVEEEEELQTVVDYFNLCAEEYWWYRAGYIPQEVWRSWCRGMLQYIDNPPIKQHWDEEVTQGSYYGLTLDRVRAGSKP
jgi:hypothetical protein